jgi:hypothetical protein
MHCLIQYGYDFSVTWISGNENELAKIQEWTFSNACQVYRAGALILMRARLDVGRCLHWRFGARARVLWSEQRIVGERAEATPQRDVATGEWKTGL